MRPPRQVATPVAITAALGIAFLIWAPPSTDLAAQTYRADLFADQGPTVWSNAWYSGFHVPGYSLVYPPVAALLGVRTVGVLAAVAASLAFTLIARRRFGDLWLAGSVAFAIGVGAWLVTGRITFLLGVAVGLWAVFAAERGRLGVAAVLAALTPAASPVAGVFAAIAGVAIWLAGERRPGFALAVPAAAATALIALAFPTPGEQPFSTGAFLAVLALGAGGLLLIPREHPALRIGVVLYTALAVAVFVVPTPIGNNVNRLGALVAAPVALLVLRRRWPATLIALVCLPLLYWQLNAPVRDALKARDDPASERAFFEPLVAQLDRVTGDGPVRVHVPPTENRWEAVYVGETYPLARGWLRQLESEDFDLFRDGGLDAESYRAWLDDHAIAYVAVPDADRDYMAEDEVELIEGGLPYLRDVWTSPDWRLYEVHGGGELVAGEGAELVELTTESFRLRADTPGTYLVRVHWTAYWEPEGAPACLERNEDWTRVEVEAPGEVAVDSDFSLAGVLGRDRVCSESG
jgi:hypothetical protein